MKKTVLLLTALAGLTVAAYGQEQILTANQDILAWDGWDIHIGSLYFITDLTDGLQHVYCAKDTIFIHFGFSVKNNTHNGEAFIPQNNIKIVIGDNAFDAADEQRGTFDYVKNIEPTLVRVRKCYFEIPKALAKGLFVIRFSRSFEDPVDVHVTISTKGEPVPAGMSFDPSPWHNGYKITKEQEHTDNGRYDGYNADTDLNRAWAALSPEQRNQLRQEERNWIWHNNSITTKVERDADTRARAAYIWSLVGK
jgi:hypothetical protein